MKLHHFSNWQKEEINPEQIYETDWNESYYWTQKQRSREPSTDMSQSLEGISNMLSSFGTKFDLTFFSNEINNSKYYAELLKEYIFEEIRLLEFADKPSRKNCMFLAPIETEVFEYCKNLNFIPSNLTMLEVEIQNASSLHYADLRLLNCNSFEHDEKVKNAREYWKGTEERGLNTEILFRGSFKMKIKE